MIINVAVYMSSEQVHDPHVLQLYATESPELAGALNVYFEQLENMQLEAREARGKGQLLSDRQWKEKEKRRKTALMSTTFRLRLKHILAQRKTSWGQNEPRGATRVHEGARLQCCNSAEKHLEPILLCFNTVGVVIFYAVMFEREKGIIAQISQFYSSLFAHRNFCGYSHMDSGIGSTPSMNANTLD
eukprot:1162020-Pelagomonas_calceolata.AAC.7